MLLLQSVLSVTLLGLAASLDTCPRYSELVSLSDYNLIFTDIAGRHHKDVSEIECLFQCYLLGYQIKMMAFHHASKECSCMDAVRAAGSGEAPSEGNLIEFMQLKRYGSNQSCIILLCYLDM